MYMGEGVGGLKRGKASLHKNGVLNNLRGVASELTFGSRAEFTRDAAIEQISRITGVGEVQL